MQATLAARHAGLILGQPVEQWIADRRTEGKSWRQVVRELATATGGEIDITEKTAKTWLDAAQPDRSAAAAGGA